MGLWKGSVHVRMGFDFLDKCVDSIGFWARHNDLATRIGMFPRLGEPEAIYIAVAVGQDEAGLKLPVRQITLRERED